MKKLSGLTLLLIVTNLITIAALVWCCCCKCHRACLKANDSTTNRVAGGPPGTCCPGNCYPANCTIATKFDLDRACKMIDRYRQHHWEAINQYCPSIYNQNSTDPNNPNLYTPADPNNAVRVDARSAWFSLETLKAFINTIETRTCANTAPNCMPALGVRIYYAEYPTDATELQTYAPENGTID